MTDAVSGEVALSLDEVEDLTFRALRAVGVPDAQARSVAASVVTAEAEGVQSHGLALVPTYCGHARVRKVVGDAAPSVDRPRPGLVRVDAKDGFAHPAIDLGIPLLDDAAQECGIAMLAVTNSYICGALGYHVQRIAERGLLAIGFANAPASIAPAGGIRPVFGTNPIAMAVPRPDGPPLVLDQSASVVAKREVVLHRARGQAIPEGWALDREGRPTTDPVAALDGGTMVPAGGYKGANIALVVEVMAAWLTASSLSIDASSFGDDTGGPPRTGQTFIAVAPGFLAGADRDARFHKLSDAISSQPGAQLPGARRGAARDRTATHGVRIPSALHGKLREFAGQG